MSLPAARRCALLGAMVLAVVAVFGAAEPPALAAPRGAYDLVVRGGRVMDPESGLDAIRDLGITDGKITSVSKAALAGRDTIDATGLVVAPGFIDLHAHGQDAANYALKAADGVTTALELELGTADVDAFYDARAGKALIHHGVAVGHVPVRMAVMGDAPAYLPAATARCATVAGSDAQIADIRRRIEDGLARGALAVGLGIAYTKAASRWEILEVFRAAAAASASAHVHMRKNGLESTEALEEVVAAAAITGAPLHVVHLHASSRRRIWQNLQIIDEARRRGLDVTAECYPYDASLTDLSSGVFDPGWQAVMEIDYKDLLWIKTGEWLTAATFDRYRKQGGMVGVHGIPPEAVTAALAHPLVMVASDSRLDGGKGHPRSAGCYARVLGRYVREEKTLPLMDALRKMSLMPARRLERRVPSMKNKGRIKVGADADLTIFDPARVVDRSTFAEPALPPDGIPHVLVAGVPVVRDGRVQTRVSPGQPVRAPSAPSPRR